MNIIVTGTSRGIGKELAESLSQNHRIIALSRSVGKLVLNENIRFHSYDLANPDKDALVNVLNEYKHIDLIINNAGYLVNKPFGKISLQDMHDMVGVNYLGPYFLIQTCVPYMEGGFKHIVNISTMGAVQGSVKFPGLTGYSSSKGALSILTECLAEELKERAIHVNTLALGAVQTEMLQEAFPGYQSPVSAKEMALFIQDFALNKAKLFNGKIISVSSTTP